MKQLTIELEWAPNEKSQGTAEVSRIEILEMLNVIKTPDVLVELKSENAPDGHPMFHLTGTEAELTKVVDAYSNGYDVLETFLI